MLTFLTRYYFFLLLLLIIIYIFLITSCTVPMLFCLLLQCFFSIDMTCQLFPFLLPICCMDICFH
ncbi:hypothetical protein T4B_549 [Trichinella pseudospiralis]|uniref:Uncharacterized protein n=1 Tax=Trichinella pseudospiralis TaxID=6337 RepID=A0A0V1GF16_TRIPS|nr:hypothetical protein T4B_549 [Trichinella pseudospiralis]